MTDDRENRASISIRPTHGSASQTLIPSVIPRAKREREVFWVDVLVGRQSEGVGVKPTVSSFPDDPHGNHDVLVKFSNDNSVGVQVTELTYELERERRAHCRDFKQAVMECVSKRGIAAPEPLAVKCFVPFVPSRRYRRPGPEIVATAVEEYLRRPEEGQAVDIDHARLFFEWVSKGNLYSRSSGRIGFDCDLDALPRTVDMYRDAVTSLKEKKEGSISPWLVIWSLTFWRDRHWLSDAVLEHMVETFSMSQFERVFFLESMDGPEFFQANLSIHQIKT